MNITPISKFESFNRYYFDASTARDFIKYLMSEAKVIAPHKKGSVSYVYKEVVDEADVVFDYPRTIHSVKKMFMPPKEKLLSFNTKTNSFNKVSIKAEKKIFFGILADSLIFIYFLAGTEPDFLPPFYSAAGSSVPVWIGNLSVRCLFLARLTFWFSCL